MFLTRHKQRAFIGIILKPYCIGLSYSIWRDTICCLIAYQEHTAPWLLDNLIINNSTAFKNYIEQFIKEYSIKNSFCVIACAETGLAEAVAPANHEDTLLLFKKLVWQAVPLVNSPNFYYCGIRREQIVHYQLCAHRCGLKLIGISSITMAQLLIASQEGTTHETIENLTMLKNSLNKLNAPLLISHGLVFIGNSFL